MCTNGLDMRSDYSSVSSTLIRVQWVSEATRAIVPMTLPLAKKADIAGHLRTASFPKIVGHKYEDSNCTPYNPSCPVFHFVATQSSSEVLPILYLQPLEVLRVKAGHLVFQDGFKNTTNLLQLLPQPCKPSPTRPNVEPLRLYLISSYIHKLLGHLCSLHTHRRNLFPCSGVIVAATSASRSNVKGGIMYMYDPMQAARWMSG